MKKNFRLFGICLLGVILTACIAVTSLTPAPPTVPVASPTNTAFVPDGTALPTATHLPVATNTVTAVPPTETSMPGQTVTIYQIHMLGQENGWGWTSLSDGSSRVLRTQDGGATWNDVSPQGQALTPYSSSFLDAQNAWVALYDSATTANLLLRTSDGGKTWVSLPQKDIENANYQFTSPQDGVAESAGVGAGNLYLNLYSSNDGGASWSPILIAAPNTEPGLAEGTIHLCNICGDSLYYNPARLVVTYGDLASDPGGAVRISVSTDLGQHWKDKNLPLSDPKYADGLVVPKSPIFFGNDGLLPVSIGKYSAAGTMIYSVLVIYTTHDGGQSWNQAPAILENGSGFFDSPQVLSMQDAFVRCGKSLCSTHDGAQTWQTLPASLDFDINSSGSYVSQFEFTDPKTGWVVTSDGTNYELWKSSDGGSTWAKLAPTLVK